MTRPIYRDPAGLALVFAGGGAGTLARAAVSAWMPASASAAFAALLIVNVVGALVIGLVAALAARGTRRASDDLSASGARGPLIGARAKLFLTTGFCGGLTSYSSFALLTASRISAGALAAALGGAALMLGAGLAAVALGDRLGAAIMHASRTDGESGNQPDGEPGRRPARAPAHGGEAR